MCRLQLDKFDLQLGALRRELLQQLVLLSQFDCELICLHVEGGGLQLALDKCLLNRAVLDA